MPLREYRCGSCGCVLEHLERFDDDVPYDCEACGTGGALELVPSAFAIRMAGGPPRPPGGDWSRYDSSTLQTHAGAKEAAYEVARESGIDRMKASEAADKAADGMREAGARLVATQERTGQRAEVLEQSKPKPPAQVANVRPVHVSPKLTRGSS